MSVEVRNVKAEIEQALEGSLKKAYPEMTDFTMDWSRNKWELVHFTIPPIDPTVSDPSAFLATDWPNCINAAQKQVWKDSAETDDTFTYSFTEGLELGMSIEVGEDLLIENAEVKFSAKLNFSATQTKTVTKKHSREVDIELTVPACTHVYGQALLYTGKFDVPFEASVKVTGPLYFSGKIPNGVVGPRAGATIEEQLESLNIKNQFDAKGILGGVVGIRTEIVTNGTKPKCPPESDCVKSNISYDKASAIISQIN
jgi:hypothetical protein